MELKKYTKEYTIRSYECDRNNNLRIVTLMNIFQDMADINAAQLGLGLDYVLSKGFAWVGSNYEIRIKRLTKIHEKVKIVTWPAVEKKLAAIRDYEVYGKDGERIIAASSQWILINFMKKRPISLRDNLPEYQIIDDRAIETEFEGKIKEVERIDEQTKFRVRFDDIDLNKHVNNGVYALWASEAVNPDFRLSHNPSKIEINYKKEGHIGEKITVLTECDGLVTTHSIQTYDGDNRELARARIEWAENEE